MACRWLKASPGDRVDRAIIADLSSHLLALFAAEDGLPGDMNGDTGKRFVNLHNVREALNGLTALIRWNNEAARAVARQLVRTIGMALDPAGKLHLERLPSYIDGYNHQPSMEGRAVDALVRYYRVTQDAEAIDVALRMTRYALDTCFTPLGALTEAAGTHGHSINALVAGMADLALLLEIALCSTGSGVSTTSDCRASIRASAGRWSHCTNSG